MTRYLKVVDILVLHALQIERFGGGTGLRDPGQLEAAVFRPQSGYYSDIIAQAAALWESLSQNHPFIDGNKRTALAATLTFLIVNGHEVTVADTVMWNFLSDLYDNHRFKFEALDVWLRQHAKPIR
jgi:death-on-curing protein